MDLKRHQTIAKLLNRVPLEEPEKKKFTCGICGKEFNHLVEVRHHRNKEHPDESRRNKNTIGGPVRSGGDG